MPAFEAKCSMKLEGENLLDLHFAISEFSSLTEERRDVLEAAFLRRDELEDVEFLLEAEDEQRALALAKTLITDIEKAAQQRFGRGAVQPGQIEVQAEGEETLAILDQLAEMVDGASAGDLLAELEDDEVAEPLGDPFEAMQEVGTNADGHNLTTEDIVERFQDWSQTTPFDIVDVGSSYVTVVFEDLPADVEAFAAEAYAFCPDLADDIAELDNVVDAENIDDLARAGIAKQIREERALRFWWD